MWLGTVVSIGGLTKDCRYARAGNVVNFEAVRTMLDRRRCCVIGHNRDALTNGPRLDAWATESRVRMYPTLT